MIDPRVLVPLETLVAGLALWQGRIEVARQAVERGLACVGRTDDTWYAAPLLWHGLRVQGELAAQARYRITPALAEGPARAAEALLARVRDLPAPPDSDGVMAATMSAYRQMCEAEMARVVGSPEPGRWVAVAQAWDVAGQPYPACYARWQEAEVLLGLPQQAGRAAPVLKHAFRVASSMRAEPMCAALRRLAQAAQIVLDEPTARRVIELPDPRTALAAEAGLTKRETQVLNLLVEGKTNRGIAAGLDITEKTASVHVSNIMAKLGVRTRVEAVTLVHRRTHPG